MAEQDPGVMVAGADRVSWSKETYVISYDDAPKSLNAGGTGSKRHWSVGHKEKQMWEGIYGMLLIARKVPRGMSRVRIEVLLEFKHRNRRDEENYRSSVSKPFADALVKGGWLADDTREFFELADFRIDSGVELPTKARTTITIQAQYETQVAS